MVTRVSVIVPVYNGERFVGDALDSIVGQTHPDVELIVVDDGSTDGSTNVVARTIASVPHAVLVQQENAGVAAARNAGIAVASSELVAFCDHDDIWQPEKLERQLEFLSLHPEIDVVLVRQEPFLDDVECAPDWLIPEPVFGVAVACCRASGCTVARRSNVWACSRKTGSRSTISRGCCALAA